MATYTLETPRGKRLTIEAQSPDDAMDLADRWDIEDHAASEAQRLGVSPDLALRVMNRESGGNVSARSPKGAMGPMQLMPGTAKDLGVDPADPYQSVTGGVTYLKKQLDAFGGDEAKALAAYNAGPGAVRKYGGVPPYGETQAYVAALAGKGRPATPAAAMAPKGAPAAPVARPSPTIAQDALSGFLQPFRNLGHDLAERHRVLGARAAGGLPKSLGEAASDTVGDLVSPFRMIGDVLGLGSAPVQAAIRPTARAVVKYGPQTYAPPQLQISRKGVSFSDPRALGRDEAQAAIESDLNTALSAVRPANATPRAPKLQPMSVDELKAASDAAWRKVDASGFRFNNADVQAAAGDIGKLVADEGGAELYPKSAALAKRIDSLAQKGDLSVAQLNRLRAQVGEKLLQPGSDEAALGGQIKDRLESLIVSANDPSLKDARALYMRYRKVKDVTDRLDSADLRASSTYGGGNLNNAVRQNLRPLIDPKSPQRMRNLTPAEAKAMNTAVRGTAGQNAVRLAGKALDPRGLLGASVQTMLGIPSHGISAASIPVGMAASEAGKAMTLKNVQKLLDLMSVGGVLPTPGAYAPMPVSSLLSPAGLTGVGVTTAPLARIPAPAAPSSKKKPASR